MKLTKSNITFRMSRMGDPIVSNNGENICNIFQRILYMVPGTDDYNPDMGLDIVSRSKLQYTEGTRDTDYETRIVDQLFKYTDIVPLNVIAIYQDRILRIYMDCTIDNQEFRLQSSSDLDKFSTQILPKQV